MPETFVLVNGELAVARQPLQGALFEEELRIVVEVLEHLALEHEKPARNDTFGDRRLLVELQRPRALDLDLAVAGGRMHAGDGGDPPLAMVKIEQRRDVDIAHRVAVSE